MGNTLLPPSKEDYLQEAQKEEGGGGGWGRGRDQRHFVCLGRFGWLGAAGGLRERICYQSHIMMTPWREDSRPLLGATDPSYCRGRRGNGGGRSARLSVAAAATVVRIVRDGHDSGR